MCIVKNKMLGRQNGEIPQKNIGKFQEENSMKRRVLAGILAGLLTLGALAGCGGSQTTGGSSEGGEDSAAGGEESITMILALRDEFLSTLESGAQEAAKEMGINLNTVDANGDVSKMIQFIETAKNDGQKAVIVNMVDPETAQQCVEAAGDMKVIFVNRPPVDTKGVLNENVVYVGSDENFSGKYQGDWLVEKFKAENKTDIKYILLNGTIGNVSTTLRTESVLKALKDGGINATEATAPLACDFDRANAQDMITPLLKTTEYDCIIANNDAMALGAIEAMKAEGIDTAKIPVVGIDATADGRAAVEEGTLGMTVFQDAYGQGFGALSAAKNLIDGKAVNEGTEYELDETGFIVWVPFEPVTADNVADYAD
jgi:ABC-type sugar transport system substrate-binding protein